MVSVRGEEGNPASDFAELEGLPWHQVFFDSGRGDWKQSWSIDGEKGKVTNTDLGMDFMAGPDFRDDASHAVLWTKSEFSGDLKIDYAYTRLDQATRAVNIIYIHTRGKGIGPYHQDVLKWQHLRSIPPMSTYYNNIHTLHISYAAFQNNNSDPSKDYIRARRYLPNAGNRLSGTDIQPDYFQTGLFQPGIPHRISIIKRGSNLSMKITNPGKIYYCQWDISQLPDVNEGRIGLRHMFTRGARYADFSVYQIPEELAPDPQLAVVGQEFTTRVAALKSPLRFGSDYRLWVPDGVRKIRCVIAVNMRAAGKRLYFKDQEWRELARRIDGALMWCGFEAHDVQSNGAGQSMVDALTQFGDSTGFVELAEVPLILWGHSMGGRVAQDFTRWKPERVAGFVMALRGNPSPPEFMTEPMGSIKVPGLYLMGDEDSKPTDIRNHFLNARKMHSPRAWVWLPGQNHWPKGMTFQNDSTTEDDWRQWVGHDFVIPWIEEIVRLRVGNKYSGKLIDIDPDSGWTISPETNMSAPMVDLPNLSPDLSWFPSRRSATATINFLESHRQ